MSKVIRVDNEVHALLEKNAKGFQTPNDVLRKMLKLKPAEKKKVVASTKEVR